MNVRIFMCSHNRINDIPPLCIPIQGGAAINPRLSGAIGDNDGENISQKNREYCELTVMYYAWKNEKSDYFGFCHYRRFFCFDESIRAPYIAVKTIHNRESCLGSEEKIKRDISGFDVILPRAEDTLTSVTEYYRNSRFHHIEDLELFLKIIQEKMPVLSEAATEYLSQSKQYFCNMFIMKREIFDEYCSMLFPLLEEFDHVKKSHGSFQEDRTDGYLAERFLGIFVLFKRKQGAKIREIARIDVGCTTKKIISCKVLPPESKRRFFVKKILMALRK